jgi:hypothetical protein
MVWEDSPNTKRIVDYFNKKYGQMVTPVALAKSLAVVSLRVKNVFPLNIINVSPAGHFKTRTSSEQFGIFGSARIINFGSDFTIHSLAREFDKGRKIDNKCCLINDLTLLLSSKAKSTKNRLINGLAELLSEYSYHYGDFQKDMNIDAKISIIGNITLESYMNYNKELIESTFGERCLTLFHFVTEKEEMDFNLTKQERLKMTFGDRLTLKIGSVDFVEHIPEINRIAMKWKALSLSPSGTRCFDRVMSVLGSNAVLNGRSKLVPDDFMVLEMLEGHLMNPLSPHLEIVRLALQGLSHKEICIKLGRDPVKYRPYISKVIAIYRRKGVIGLDRETDFEIEKNIDLREKGVDFGDENR